MKTKPVFCAGMMLTASLLWSASGPYFYSEDLTNPAWANWTSSSLTLQSSSNGPLGIGGQGTMMFNQAAPAGGAEIKMTVHINSPDQFDRFYALFGNRFTNGSYEVDIGTRDPFQGTSRYIAAFAFTSNGAGLLGWFPATIRDGSAVRAVLNNSVLAMYVDDNLVFAVPATPWNGGPLGIGADSTSGDANALAAVSLGSPATSLSISSTHTYFTDDLRTPAWNNWTNSDLTVQGTLGIGGQGTMMYNQPAPAAGGEIKMTLRVNDATQYDRFFALFGSRFAPGAYEIDAGVRDPYTGSSGYVTAYAFTSNGTTRLAWVRANVHDGSVLRAVLNNSAIGVYLDDKLLFAVPAGGWNGGQLGIGASTVSGDSNAISSVSLSDTSPIL